MPFGWASTKFLKKKEQVRNRKGNQSKNVFNIFTSDKNENL
jgi:hypothetical protein